MSSPDPTRRRTLLALGSAVSVLAGCPTIDRTPESTPPPNGTVTTEPLGPGPSGGETPTANATDRGGIETPGPTDVGFSKPDGGEVTATLYGGGDCAVVLVPQVNLDRQSWDEYARRLADADYLAMAIDEGEDEKAAGVTAAVSYLQRETDVDSIVLVGASTGGEAVVRAAAAAAPDVVDGAVTLSAAGGADVAGDLTMPALFVVSEGDEERFVQTANDLAAGAAGDRQLVSYEGSAHGQRLFESSHADDLRSRLADFLERACTRTTPTATATSTATASTPPSSTATASPTSTPTE